MCPVAGHARGVAVLNAIRFVKERYGEDAHATVLRALPSSRWGTFLGELREASWEPLEDFSAYLEAARRQLAPADAEFYRELGRFAGGLERKKAAFGIMVAEPSTSMRMGPVIWKAFFDIGELQVLIHSGREAVAVIRGFPASRALCERLRGAWEGLLATEQLEVVTDERACAARGDDRCEIGVGWRARPGTPQ